MKWFTTLRPIQKALLVIACVAFIGYMIPQQLSMPVQGAGLKSYAQDSYWAYPWGKSVTHKGVDIFAKAGTPIHPATGGLVVYAGQITMGGNVVLILGPKWRLHYYAHLQQIQTRTLSIVGKGSQIGTVGATGNAKGKPPHLHYAIKTIFPYFWRADKSIQGWKKMFYLNPVSYLNESFAS
jgi:murein DD-endopeptidase MepM/ murein hydrolase activator NlpD